MRRPHYLQRFGLMCGLGLLLSGCLLKSARAPTQHFILAPIPFPERAPATPLPPVVEVKFVKMPAYLLRDAMVVRKSATELGYLEAALWAERLDQSFQQTLADNLAILLSADRGWLSAAGRPQVSVRVSVEVEQFDVDIQGQGTLTARWRLTVPGSDSPVKSGQTHQVRPGAIPRAHPQAIATTLSALIADFSQALAQAVRENATTRPEK